MIKLHDAQSFGDSSTRSEGAGVFTRPAPEADVAASCAAGSRPAHSVYFRLDHCDIGALKLREDARRDGTTDMLEVI